jgi:hypothetical protein
LQGITNTRENGGDYVRALEMSEETKVRLAEIQALSERSKGGDKEARKELRRVLRASSPEIVARCSDFAKRGQRRVVKTIATGEPVMEEALEARLDLLRTEVAGENPTVLEVMLAERIVSLWLVVEALEALMNAQLQVGPDVRRFTPSFLKFIIGWLETYHRRYLASIRELARVRKLQSNTPGIQYNTQINLR